MKKEDILREIYNRVEMASHTNVEVYCRIALLKKNLTDRGITEERAPHTYRELSEVQRNAVILADQFESSLADVRTLARKLECDISS